MRCKPPGGIAIAFLLLAALAASRPVPVVSRPPNLVVITIDTLRPDHLERYGYKLIKTLRINALAADGILIENAYTPVPLTLPSHASIFTGPHPVFHGVRDFTGFSLGRQRTTLATMLKSAGYYTGAVVAATVLEARWGINPPELVTGDLLSPRGSLLIPGLRRAFFIANCGLRITMISRKRAAFCEVQHENPASDIGSSSLAERTQSLHRR